MYILDNKTAIGDVDYVGGFTMDHFLQGLCMLSSLCVCVCLCVYICTCVCAKLVIYVCIYTDTQTHTNIHTS